MKRFLIYLTLISSVFVACQNAGSTSENGEDEKDEKKNISRRNYFITKENSYSDLFMDSAAMEKYITDKRQMLEQYKTVPPQLKPYYKDMVENYFHIIGNNK